MALLVLPRTCFYLTCQSLDCDAWSASLLLTAAHIGSGVCALSDGHCSLYVRSRRMAAVLGVFIVYTEIVEMSGGYVNDDLGPCR